MVRVLEFPDFFPTNLGFPDEIFSDPGFRDSRIPGTKIGEVWIGSFSWNPRNKYSLFPDPRNQSRNPKIPEGLYSPSYRVAPYFTSSQLLFEDTQNTFFVNINSFPAAGRLCRIPLVPVVPVFFYTLGRIILHYITVYI